MFYRALETPPHFEPQPHYKHPFMDLLSFKAVYLDAITNGGQARFDDFLKAFKVGDNGIFPKVHIQHLGNSTGKAEAL